MSVERNKYVKFQKYPSRNHTFLPMLATKSTSKLVRLKI